VTPKEATAVLDARRAGHAAARLTAGSAQWVAIAAAAAAAAVGLQRRGLRRLRGLHRRVLLRLLAAFVLLVLGACVCLMLRLHRLLAYPGVSELFFYRGVYELISSAVTYKVWCLIS
jgi:hypothetical protein